MEKSKQIDGSQIISITIENEDFSFGINDGTKNVTVERLVEIYLQGYSLRQMSKMTGIPRTTIHRRIQKELQQNNLCIKTIPQRKITNVTRVDPYQRMIFPTKIFYSELENEKCIEKIDSSEQDIKQSLHNLVSDSNNTSFEPQEEPQENRIDKFNFENNLDESLQLLNTPDRDEWISEFLTFPISIE